LTGHIYRPKFLYVFIVITMINIYRCEHYICCDVTHGVCPKYNPLLSQIGAPYKLQCRMSREN